MSCFGELTYAIYVDRELSPEEAREVEQHLATCAPCQARVAALEEENRALAAVLAEAESPAGVPAPAWRGAAAWTGLGVLGLGALLHATRGRVAAEVDWWGLAFDVAFFLASHAGLLGQGVGAVALATMLGLTLGGVALLRRRPAAAVIGLVALACVTGFASPARALETRAGVAVTVPAGEVVRGTLVAAADTVRVEGTIEGDLVAAAKSVEVLGLVTGDLIVVGRDARLGGTVDGNVYALVGALRVDGRVTRSLYGLNRETTVAPAGRVDGDATVMGRSLEVAGAVGRSVSAFVATARVAGSVARDLTVAADRVDVRAFARIGGALRARVRAPGDVAIEPGVTIGGAREVRLAPAGAALLAEPQTYFWLATQLFGALLVGVVGLWLRPRFFHASVDAVGAWWRSLGLGVIVLVAAPVAVLLAALTLVGLPLALVGLGLYLLGLYAAKIVVGAFLGRALLRRAGAAMRDSVLALAAGLLLLTLAGELPIVGTPVQLVVLCLGLGALSRQLYRSARAERA